MKTDAPNRKLAEISIRTPASSAPEVIAANPETGGGGAGESNDGPTIPEVLPLLPLRNMVLFPGMVSPLSIGRPASVKMLGASLPHSKIIGVVAQREAKKDDPGPDDVFQVGTAAIVLKMLRHTEEGAVVLVQGLHRFRIRKFVQTQPWLRAEIDLLPAALRPGNAQEWEAELKNLRESGAKLAAASPEVPEGVEALLMNLEDPGQLSDLVAANLNLDGPARQQLLEETDVVRRVRAVQQRVTAQLEIVKIQQRLQQDVSSQFSDLQRRAYLHEQIRAIQRELGEGAEGVEQQVEQLRRRLTEARPPAAVVEQAERELKRLNYVPPASAEFSVIVSYIETLVELPWSKVSEDNLDLRRAQRILDRDHHDLEKVKRRLIEYLAVRKLNPAGHGPILCFLGPPGVGKTSLGRSIADALGRKFARLSLGGMRDEAEIRGHRRTYIGSMPGQLIQHLRRLGTRNPVVMLDEIDKLGTDFRGDPASALLEVLDPQQNNAFVDHYLDVPFDLSQVIFITTANIMDPVPPALRDRMEVIELPGYTDREKRVIARDFLLKRQLKENGLRPEQCKWSTAALEKVIEDYTREAGVRELERQIGAVCRAVAAQIARGDRRHVGVGLARVREHLGPAKYIRETRLKTDRPGVATGLAYTATGGEVLHVEATRYPGKGNITLTGQLGDVMAESVQAALSLVRTRARELGLAPESFKGTDIHVHVPSGAVPKDGPSAGVTMFTALASLFTNTPVRATVAMTGEITLRGLVLPIGGLKEKSLAALRAGIKQVIIPKLNEKDLAELPTEVKQCLRFTAVDNVDEVLAAALDLKPRIAPVADNHRHRALTRKHRLRPGKFSKRMFPATKQRHAHSIERRHRGIAG